MLHKSSSVSMAPLVYPSLLVPKLSPPELDAHPGPGVADLRGMLRDGRLLRGIPSVTFTSSDFIV